MPAETPQEAYDRGADAGRIEQRLATYDRHFETINGSVMETAKQLERLTLEVQRLVDRMDANAATVLATANALKAADEARRDKTEQSWSPFARLMAGLGGMAAVATLLGLYLAFRH